MNIQEILAYRAPAFTQGTELTAPRKGFGRRFTAYAESIGMTPAQAWTFGPVPFHAWLKTSNADRLQDATKLTCFAD